MPKRCAKAGYRWIRSVSSPKKPPTAPTFGNRINSTFENSWEALVQFGQGVVLFVVGLIAKKRA